MTREIRIVVNQCGAALELHGHTPSPITIAMIRPDRLDSYRKELAERNPDMRYASIGQVYQAFAQQWFAALNKSGMPALTLNPHVWTYNASTETYSIA